MLYRLHDSGRINPLASAAKHRAEVTNTRKATTHRKDIARIVPSPGTGERITSVMPDDALNGRAKQKSFSAFWF
jgi:hypothetical protein